MKEKNFENKLDKVKGEKLALTQTLDQLELEKATLEKDITRFWAIATLLFTAEQNRSTIMKLQNRRSILRQHTLIKVTKISLLKL